MQLSFGEAAHSSHPPSVTAHVSALARKFAKGPKISAAAVQFQKGCPSYEQSVLLRLPGLLLPEILSLSMPHFSTTEHREGDVLLPLEQAVEEE